MTLFEGTPFNGFLAIRLSPVSVYPDAFLPPFAAFVGGFWSLFLSLLTAGIVGSFRDDRVAVGLADVEDACHFPAPQDGRRGGVVGSVVGSVAGVVVSAVGAGGEDADAVLAAADLAAEGLPALVAGDAGGVGALGEDGEGVEEAVAVEATLQFSVFANTNNISRLELFTTGGSAGFVTGQASAVISVAGPNLGVGLHPFYALVTAGTGQQYRTETHWIRLGGPDAPFPLSITAPPPLLSWPATPGRSYDVLSAATLSNTFQLRATVVATNALGQWSDTNAGGSQQFYRVRTSN